MLRSVRDFRKKVRVPVRSTWMIHVIGLGALLVSTGAAVAQERESTEEVVATLLERDVAVTNTDLFVPIGEDGPTVTGFDSDDIPTSLNELTNIETRAYDLSLTRAGQLNIPVIGSVSGGYQRRVVVLERVAYKELEADEGIQHQFGYAIRLCITISDWNATSQVSVPFLAASAELGQIQAKWIMQVRGLAGEQIDRAILPPTELSVENFVLAKQSLSELIGAVRHPTTAFSAALIATVHPIDSLEREYRIATAKSYAVSRLAERQSLADARERLGSDRADVNDAIAEVYQELGGITDPDARPPEEVQRRARELLDGVRTDVR